MSPPSFELTTLITFRFAGSDTNLAVGFQIAGAVLGQSLLPALIGLMARKLGLEIIGPALLFSALVLAGLHLSLTLAGPKVGRELEVTA